jgi:hypothetical protein
MGGHTNTMNCSATLSDVATLPNPVSSTVSLQVRASLSRESYLVLRKWR